MVKRIKKFQDSTGIDQAGLAKIAHEDLMAVVNPRYMTEKPVGLEGPTVPIDYAVVDRQIKASELKGIEVTENGKVVFRGTGHEFGAGSREFSDGDREMMRQLDLTEEDYRKYLDPSSEEKSPAVGPGRELISQAKVDLALGLSYEDYARFG